MIYEKRVERGETDVMPTHSCFWLKEEPDHFNLGKLIDEGVKEGWIPDKETAENLRYGFCQNVAEYMRFGGNCVFLMDHYGRESLVGTGDPLRLIIAITEKEKRNGKLTLGDLGRLFREHLKTYGHIDQRIIRGYGDATFDFFYDFNSIDKRLPITKPADKIVEKISVSLVPIQPQEYDKEKKIPKHTACAAHCLRTDITKDFK